LEHVVHSHSRMAPKKDAKAGKGGKIAPKTAKAPKAGGGKQKKKKWSKGKVREKLNNLVLFDSATRERLESEVPSFRLITPSIISERLKINGSLARRALRYLEGKGLIRAVSRHHTQVVYRRAIVAGTTAETAGKEATKDAKAGKAGKPAKDGKDAKAGKAGKPAKDAKTAKPAKEGKPAKDAKPPKDAKAAKAAKPK